MSAFHDGPIKIKHHTLRSINEYWFYLLVLKHRLYGKRLKTPDHHIPDHMSSLNSIQNLPNKEKICPSITILLCTKKGSLKYGLPRLDLKSLSGPLNSIVMNWTANCILELICPKSVLNGIGTLHIFKTLFVTEQYNILGEEFYPPFCNHFLTNLYDWLVGEYAKE